MVAISKIDVIERETIRIGDKEIPVSETYRKELMRLLMRLLMR